MRRSHTIANSNSSNNNNHNNNNSLCPVAIVGFEGAFDVGGVGDEGANRM